MKRARSANWLIALISLTSGACGRGPAHAVAPAKTLTQPSGLIVHEWGTFTSIQDPTGVALGGMHHDDAPLPSFVVQRGFAVAATRAASGVAHMEEPTQRMETPVLYLHSARKLAVSVRVNFPNGLMTQWYPDCSEVLPAAKAVEHVAGGSLKWQVDVDPALDHALAPGVATDSIWAPSRQVQVASLRARLGKADQVEKFLFYRGVGKFDTPIVVQAPDAAALHVSNRAPEAVPAAFLLSVTDADHAAFAPLGRLVGRTTMHVPLPTQFLPMATYLAQARPAIAQVLQDSGLYADEAWALVNTWSKSYFQTPGTRVLFVLPQPWTDALLPLTVVPRPDKTVRTLIGRIEVLTAPQLAQLTGQVQAAFAAIGPPATDGSSPETLAAANLAAALQPYAESKLLAVCPLLPAHQQAWCQQALGLAHQGWGAL